MRKNLKRGQPTPMAVFTGVHPAVELGCLSFTGLDVDEFTIAGAMLGEPLQLVRCETIDLEVPAWAEMVLECEIDPTEREPEAPFAEYPGTYGPERNNPVIHVKAITMRRNAHHHNSFVGHRDNLLLSDVTRNSQIYKTCRIASGGVKAVYVPPSGRSRSICYAQMEKLIEGDPKNAAMAAFTADPFLKYMVVVDDNVDITNDADVWHAIATRCASTLTRSWSPTPAGRPSTRPPTTRPAAPTWSARLASTPPARPITHRRSRRQGWTGSTWTRSSATSGSGPAGTDARMAGRAVP
jgi:2,5-furandicarboxylate decarboxylase 1